MTGSLSPRMLEESLQRFETLMSGLDQIGDLTARETARELLELMLDLHGLALARMSAVIAAAAGGAALTEQLVADPYVNAVLLLHGLHPHDAAARLQRMLARMSPQWNARGFHVDLLDVGTATARVRLHKNGSTEAIDEFRLEVEAALADAAPDLDDISVEMELQSSTAASATSIDTPSQLTHARHPGRAA